MKNFKFLFIYFLSLFLAGCGILPFKTDIKENHFRFENFQRDIGEYIYLMCYRQRPTRWDTPKQYLSGEHSLWIEANISDSKLLSFRKEAFVFFKVKLDSGKSYMLNRKLEGENISIWIQDVESGQKVSKVITTDLKPAVFEKKAWRKKQCKSSSV